MDAERIVKITPQSIRQLVESRSVKAVDKPRSNEYRKSERWPFPGTVEVWLPEDAYGDRHLLATLHNLSIEGLAMRTRRPVQVGTKLSLAIHQPSLSCYGHAIVRHCSGAPVGYLIGVEFDFEQTGEDE